MNPEGGFGNGFVSGAKKKEITVRCLLTLIAGGRGSSQVHILYGWGNHVGRELSGAIEICLNIELVSYASVFWGAL